MTERRIYKLVRRVQIVKEAAMILKALLKKTKAKKVKLKITKVKIVKLKKKRILL